MTTAIERILAREILDSRGNPTVKWMSCWQAAPEDGAVPSGDQKRYNGKGGLRTVANVYTEIADAVVCLDALDQAGVDRTGSWTGQPTRPGRISRTAPFLDATWHALVGIALLVFPCGRK